MADTSKDNPYTECVCGLRCRWDVRIGKEHRCPHCDRHAFVIVPENLAEGRGRAVLCVPGAGVSMWRKIQVLLHGTWQVAETRDHTDESGRIAVFIGNRFGPSIWALPEFIRSNKEGKQNK